jgi:hypothetical protein
MGFNPRISSGPVAIAAAHKGRTYDCTRPSCTNAHKNPCQTGASTYDNAIGCLCKSRVEPLTQLQDVSGQASAIAHLEDFPSQSRGGDCVDRIRQLCSKAVQHIPFERVMQEVRDFFRSCSMVSPVSRERHGRCLGCFGCAPASCPPVPSGLAPPQTVFPLSTGPS